MFSPRSQPHPQMQSSSITSAPSWTPSAPKTEPKSQSFIDWLKPHRSVAIARLKNNGLAMIVFLLITQLAPIAPSPLRCLWLVFGGGKGMTGFMYWSCCAELLLFSVLSFNILQAYVGLKYPPPSCSPVDSPARRAQLRSPTPLRPLKPYTPQSSLRKSNPFDSTYVPSPVSTPSRTLSYKPVLGGSTSSTSSLFSSQSPSPFSKSSLASSPLAYRSRQSLSSVRPLNASFLSKLSAADDDDE